MALIKCNECGKEISDKAKTCIHCGCPIEQEIKCVECGCILNGKDKICKKCGCPINNKKISNNFSLNNLQNEKNTFCLAGLIISIICMFIDFVGLVSATGLTISIIGKSKATNPKDNTYATIGIVLSSIGLFVKVLQLFGLILQSY